MILSGCTLLTLYSPAQADGAVDRPTVELLIAKHASANDVPEALVHRVIERESKYKPRAARMGSYGLMQIRHGTARALGYSGSASGLLDADTNLTYGVLYLAKAYRAAGGNQDRALRLYKSGF
jgi:soluble lytic murein transglycosylase-like protein